MASWSLLQDPLTDLVRPAVLTKSPTGTSFSAGVSAVGLLRPLRRAGPDFASGTGIALVLANVGQVIGTVCTGPAGIQGELPWRPEFGSLVHLLRLRGNSPALADQARAFVSEAVRKWEPRCRVRGTRVEREATTLRIVVVWDLLASAGSNQVLVAGVETSVALG